MLRQVIERVSGGLVLKRWFPPQFVRVTAICLSRIGQSGLPYYHSDLNSADPTLFHLAQELVEPASAAKTAPPEVGRRWTVGSGKYFRLAIALWPCGRR